MSLNTSIKWVGAMALLSLSLGCDNSEPTKATPDLPVVETEKPSPKPFETEDSRWVFVEDSNMVCTDGSTTGFGIRHNPDSKGLIVHMQDGGGCFNDISCQSAVNMDGFTENDFWSEWSKDAGLLNDEFFSNNPFKDFSHVFIPYCSGDVFVGSTDSGFNGLVQQGSNNVKTVLDRVAHHMKDSFENVLLSGSSAGGVGALFNYEHAKDAFGSNVKGLVSDSAPILDDNVLTPCLQDTLRTTWGIEDSLPVECEGCENLQGGGLTAIYDYLANKYKGDHFGIVGTKQDPVFRLFYSFGVPCTDSGLDTPDFDFANGVEHFEARMSQHENVHTEFLDVAEHALFISSRDIDSRLQSWLFDFASKL